MKRNIAGILFVCCYVSVILKLNLMTDLSIQDTAHKYIKNEQPTHNKVVAKAPATTGSVFQIKDKILTYTLNHMFPDAKFERDSYPVSLKWAVVTTIFSPTKVIKKLSEMNEWCTVIVADRKSLSKEIYTLQLAARHDACVVYLNVSDQEKLGYSILDYIQLDSFGRKNIGYLFAIQHGAQVIYDTDDDNEISDQMLMEHWALPEWSLESEGLFRWLTTGSNPYPIHGGKHGWPRGLPLDQIKNPNSSALFADKAAVNKADICIVQSLANEEPDVDAIYRLTNPDYPLTFGSNPLLATRVTGDQMAPFNAQATLFFKEAFPFMLLPVTVHGRVSDIWRAYIAQAVMKCTLIFSSPWVTQIRNSHNYLADFEAEIPLYTQSSAIVDHLVSKTGKYSSLPEAMTEAYEYGLLGQADVGLAFAWQSDLQRATAGASGLELEAKQPSQFSHLFIAMGRGIHLRQWKDTILLDRMLKHVDLLLGVFDEPVEALGCEGGRVQCVSLDGTTWTTGRNALAKAAFKREIYRRVQYTYWTFIDADIVIRCIVDGMPGLQSNDKCLAKYDLILQQTLHPIVALMSEGYMAVQEDSFLTSITAFDACWNSMHRRAIPVLLPYQADQDHVSWWSSQAIFWFRMGCFAPHYASVPLSVVYNNPEHNPYPRNQRNWEEESAIGRRIQGALVSKLQAPPYSYEELFTKDKIRPLSEIAQYDWIDGLDIYKLCYSEFSPGFKDFITS
jgi:hypothetical protein